MQCDYYGFKIGPFQAGRGFLSAPRPTGGRRGKVGIRVLDAERHRVRRDSSGYRQSLVAVAFNQSARLEPDDVELNRRTSPTHLSPLAAGLSHMEFSNRSSLRTQGPQRE